MYECLSFLDSYLPLGSHVMENYSLTKLAILSICLHKIRQQRQGKQHKYKQYCKKEQIQRFIPIFFISLYLPLIFWQISYHINLLQLYKASGLLPTYYPLLINLDFFMIFNAHSNLYGENVCSRLLYYIMQKDLE